MESGRESHLIMEKEELKSPSIGVKPVYSEKVKVRLKHSKKIGVKEHDDIRYTLLAILMLAILGCYLWHVG